MTSSSEIQTQDALDAVASGIQAGDDFGELMGRADSPASDAAELAGVIQALHDVLTPVEPRLEFVESLRAELAELIEGRPGVVERVQQMPLRISLAAALALVAGCLLFFMRRLFDSDAPQEIQEEAVATPL
jgi:hypothetical protein